MKHKKFILGSLACVFFAVSVFVSCKKKNTECTGIIYTYTVQNGVKTPLGGCTLIIGDIKENQDRLDTNIMRTVVTDASGYYEGTWYRQVRLPVDAVKGNYTGVAFLNLEPGNTTHLEIPLYD